MPYFRKLVFLLLVLSGIGLMPIIAQDERPDIIIGLNNVT